MNLFSTDKTLDFFIVFVVFILLILICMSGLLPVGKIDMRGADFGEWFRVRGDDPIPLGRFVTIDESLDKGVRLAEFGDRYIIGVTVDGKHGLYGDTDVCSDSNAVAVGMVGKVDVYVSDDSPKFIVRGDGVSVGIDGLARYTPNPNRTVGYAVENQHEVNEGLTVKILVK